MLLVLTFFTRHLVGRRLRLNEVDDKSGKTYGMMKEEGGFKSYEKYSNDVEKGQPPIKIESYENPNYEAEISGRYMGGRTVEDF